MSSFNLMYNLCMYYEKQKSYDKTELTFQPTLVLTRSPKETFNADLGMNLVSEPTGRATECVVLTFKKISPTAEKIIRLLLS